MRPSACWPGKATRLTSVIVALAMAITIASAAEQRHITIRVGAAVGRDGPCAQLYNDIVLGYRYFFDSLSAQPPKPIRDTSGIEYHLQLQLRLLSHNCTEVGRAAAMTSLINGTTTAPPVHLLLGGNALSATDDSLQANAAARLLLHCCTVEDAVFKLSLPYVYGMLTPASLYTSTLLRTMALRGLSRLAFVFNRDEPLHVGLCEAAMAQLPLLQELRPAFRAVLMVNYSAAEAATPRFWEATSGRVAAAKTDGLVACDDLANSTLLVRHLAARHYRLSAFWLSSWGDSQNILRLLDDDGTYALTTVQWMPSLPYADPVIGTAAQYAAAFASANGLAPSFFSAAATASGYVLWRVIRQVVASCSLERLVAAAVDVKTGTGEDVSDAFMWQEGALTCRDAVYGSDGSSRSTGGAAIRYGLSTVNMDTFFGPVGFNGYRQNVQHSVVVAQVLDGQLVSVLPLDVADRALVMPIPDEEPAGQPWAQTPAGIGIIALACCLGVLCGALVAAVLIRRRQGPGKLSVAAAVEIDMHDIQVEIPPSANPDGTFEPGEGLFRGTRVKLVVATELLPPVAPAKAVRQLDPPLIGGLQSRVGLQPLPSGNLNVDGERTTPRHAGGGCFDPRTPRGGGQPSQPLSFQPGGKAICFDEGAASSGPTPGAYAGQFSPTARGLDACALSDRGGFRKISEHSLPRQSDTGPLRKQLEWGSPQPVTAPSSVFGMLGGRSGLGSLGGLGGGGRLYGTLSKRSRSQILALVWRAVRLQHPRMCPVLGIVWEWPGLLEGGGSAPVIVRQWQEFDNLERLLENETVPLPLLTKAHVMQGVAEALAFLHAQEPPILAGHLDSSRIIIDKHFNPHLFLRLRNLDPNYPTEAAAAASRLRMRSINGAVSGSGYFRQVTNTNLNLSPIPGGGGTTFGTARPQPLLGSPALGHKDCLGAGGASGGGGGSSATALIITERTSAGNTAGHTVTFAGNNTTTTTTATTTTNYNFPNNNHNQNNNANTMTATNNNVDSCSNTKDNPRMMASSYRDTVLPFSTSPTPAAATVPSPFLRTSHDLLTIGGAESGNINSNGNGNGPGNGNWNGCILAPAAADSPVGPPSRAATNTNLTTGGGSTAAAVIANVLPYIPSKEQDIFEFGLLLCRMFVVDSPVDSGRLGVTLRLPGLDMDGAAAAPPPKPYMMDDRELEDALAELTDLSEDLGELARICLQRKPGLTAAALVRAMELEVIPSLTNAAPVRLLSKWTSGMSLRVGTNGSGEGGLRRSSAGTAAGGRGAADGEDETEVIRSSQTSFGDVAALRGVRGAGLPQTLGVARSGGSVTVLGGGKMDAMRRARTPAHHTRHHGATLTPDDLIYDIFPPKVARALQTGETVQPERYDCVSIFFSDVVGYTDLCGQLQPGEVMDLVHRLYSRFDDLIRELKLFKVETVGDAYLAVGNLRWPQPESHARLMAQFASRAVRAANSLPVHPDRPDLGHVHIRVGLHCGPVVGSVVGTLNRRYCLFGDAVNTAARMEHNSEADRVHCSVAFAALLREQWPEGARVVSRGIRQIKGKGPMETFWVEDSSPTRRSLTELN